jgi:DNA-binding transcriptional LysR family regulator
VTLRFSLRQLEYFQAVAERGSIAAASESVSVSSPSISAAISQLEEEFGIQLFVRKHAQGLSLTPGGAQFLDQVRRILQEAGKLSVLANDVTQKVRGPLNVGCLLSVAQIVLPHMRRTFQDAYPDVIFRQYERSQVALFEGLRNASLDIALTYDLNIPSDLQFKPLAVLPPYALVADDHPLSGNTSVSPQELISHPMVLLDLPISSDYFLSIFADCKQRPNVVERTQDMAVMQSLVANGVGFSFANVRLTTEQSPDGKQLRYIPLTGNLRALQIGLLQTDNAKATLTVDRFADFCSHMIVNGTVPGLQRAAKQALGAA